MENAGTQEGASTSEVNPDPNSDFYNTGRVGRRNAMPDILGSHCATSTAELPDQMSALTTSDTPKKTANGDGSGPSTSQASSSSTSWKITKSKKQKYKTNRRENQKRKRRTDLLLLIYILASQERKERRKEKSI